MKAHRSRNPRKSPLWQCVQRHHETFLARYPETYQPKLGPLRPVVPEVVEKFLQCGTLERGFARVRCDHCQYEYLLAFSCKSRWFCPSCYQRKVLSTASHLVDHVLLSVLHRHFVLALPQLTRFYVNIPLPLAAALDLEAGEQVQWQLLERSDLRLKRLAPAAPTKNRPWK